ncbi:hypothetical protein IIY59_00750 [Candidatus Saccharibacteria bacterium]|nr:hypothetical protein [Candidatus Saccharibacteria bacterium]
MIDDGFVIPFDDNSVAGMAVGALVLLLVGLIAATLHAASINRKDK